jgi:hypothetical protein
MSVLLLFLLATSAGALSTLFWIPEQDLGRGYYQMVALIVLGLLGLTATVLLLQPVEPFGAQAGIPHLALLISLVGAFLFYGSVWRERWRAGRWSAALSLVGTIGMLLLLGGHQVRDLPTLPFRSLLLSASLLTSAALLGWSLITMLLGHWYLISPRLSFRHLVLFCKVLLAAVVARLVVVGASLAMAATADAVATPDPLLLVAGASGQGMFFWFRVLWGLAIPAGLAAMALHCAQQRSNQSATGILYVLVVGSFIGEITAFYISLTVGVPV